MILAAASPYFRSLLQSGMQEALTGEIVMKDVSYETVKLLVAYSYGQVMINYMPFFWYLSPLSSTFSIILSPIRSTFERTNRLKPGFVKRAETLLISASEFDKNQINSGFHNHVSKRAGDPGSGGLLPIRSAQEPLRTVSGPLLSNSVQNRFSV